MRNIWFLLFVLININCALGDHQQGKYNVTPDLFVGSQYPLSHNHNLQQLRQRRRAFQNEGIQKVLACGRLEVCPNQRSLMSRDFQGNRFENINYQSNPYECHCDEAEICLEFGDCCISVASTLSINSPWKCSKLQSKTWALMISSCSSRNTDKELEQLCTLENVSLNTYNYTLDLPVYTVTGKFFRNVYCAVCNGVAVEDITRLSTRIMCNSDFNGTNMSLKEFELEAFYFPKLRYWNYADVYCGLYIEQFNGLKLNITIPQIRFCFPSIDFCPPDADPFISQHCSSYTQSVFSRDKIDYKNPHCALCNGVVNTTLNLKCISPLKEIQVQADILFGANDVILDYDVTCDLRNLLMNDVTKYVELYNNAVLQCEREQAVEQIYSSRGEITNINMIYNLLLLILYTFISYAYT